MPKRIPPRGSRRELIEIAQRVAVEHRVRPADLIGMERRYDLYRARRAFFVAAYATDHFSWDAIAAFCNRRGENAMRSARALAQQVAA